MSLALIAFPSQTLDFPKSNHYQKKSGEALYLGCYLVGWSFVGHSKGCNQGRLYRCANHQSKETVDSRQQTVVNNSKRQAVDSRQQTVDSRQPTVDTETKIGNFTESTFVLPQKFWTRNECFLFLFLQSKLVFAEKTVHTLNF